MRDSFLIVEHRMKICDVWGNRMPAQRDAKGGQHANNLIDVLRPI